MAGGVGLRGVRFGVFLSKTRLSEYDPKPPATAGINLPAMLPQLRKMF